jgi:hypothetical protein
MAQEVIQLNQAEMARRYDLRQRYIDGSSVLSAAQEGLDFYNNRAERKAMNTRLNELLFRIYGVEVQQYSPAASNTNGFEPSLLDQPVLEINDALDELRNTDPSVLYSAYTRSYNMGLSGSTLPSSAHAGNLATTSVVTHEYGGESV